MAGYMEQFGTFDTKKFTPYFLDGRSFDSHIKTLPDLVDLDAVMEESVKFASLYNEIFGTFEGKLPQRPKDMSRFSGTLGEFFEREGVPSMAKLFDIGSTTTGVK